MAGQPGNSRSGDVHIPLAVVPSSSSSSPFMLGAVLNLHLSKFDTPVALDMRENVYVDNVLSGCNTEDELLAYYIQSRDIMSQAKFNLRSWSTNSCQLKEVTMKDKTSDSNFFFKYWTPLKYFIPLLEKLLASRTTSFKMGSKYFS